VSIGYSHIMSNKNRPTLKSEYIMKTITKTPQKTLFIYVFLYMLYMYAHIKYLQESVALLDNSNNHTFFFLHSRILMPFVKTCLMVLPSVQTIWKSVTDVVIAPLCTSMGRSFSSVSFQLSHD
jgi:hypothetical protein